MDNRSDEQKGTGNLKKVRIDQLLDQIKEVETVNRQDESELLQEELSALEAKRILNLSLDKIAAEKKTDKRIPSAMPTNTKGQKRGLLIASLVAVCFFATTALAAELFQWDKRISNYLGIDQYNGTELSKSGMNIDVSAEQNGVTIKAIQTLGDANNMYVLFEVTTPEGTKIDPNSRFDMIYLRVEGATNLGYSCDFLPDDSDSDNQAAMLLSLEANRDINDKTINLRFKDLGHYQPGSGEVVTDFPGNWQLQWQLDYADNSVKYSINQDLTVNGKSVQVDSVTVSPIAIHVKVRGSYIKEYDSLPPEPERGDLIQITAVTSKDGTILTQEDASSGGTSINGDTYTLNMQMKKLMDQAQIQSITLNDTLIPLE